MMLPIGLQDAQASVYLDGDTWHETNGKCPDCGRKLASNGVQVKCVCGYEKMLDRYHRQRVERDEY